MTTRRQIVTVITASDGSATQYSPVVSGRLTAIHYVKTDYANTVDFTITSEAVGETLWAESNVSASATRRPRAATHATDGTAALYAAGGTAVQDLIRLSRDRVKIVLAQGGDTKTGVFHIVIEDA